MYIAHASVYIIYACVCVCVCVCDQYPVVSRFHLSFPVLSSRSIKTTAIPTENTSEGTPKNSQKKERICKLVYPSCSYQVYSNLCFCEHVFYMLILDIVFVCLHQDCLLLLIQLYTYFSTSLLASISIRNQEKRSQMCGPIWRWRPGDIHTCVIYFNVT
jgi:hypothetical protein